MKNLVMARKLLALAEQLIHADNPPPLPGKPAAPTPGAPAPAADPKAAPPSLPAAQEKQRMVKVDTLTKQLTPALEAVMPVKLAPAEKAKKAEEITKMVKDQLFNASIAKQMLALSQQLLEVVDESKPS